MPGPVRRLVGHGGWNSESQSSDTTRSGNTRLRSYSEATCEKTKQYAADRRFIGKFSVLSTQYCLLFLLLLFTLLANDTITLSHYLGPHIFVNSTKLIPLVYVFFTALESFDTTLDIDYNKD